MCLELRIRLASIEAAAAEVALAWQATVRLATPREDELELYVENVGAPGGIFDLRVRSVDGCGCEFYGRDSTPANRLSLKHGVGAQLSGLVAAIAERAVTEWHFEAAAIGEHVGGSPMCSPEDLRKALEAGVIERKSYTLKRRRAPRRRGG